MTTPKPFDPVTLPLAGLQLVEASAGTGKTFSIAALYLRLIIEQQAPVREILVMTFTRAATQELRERIRQRLARAAQIASQRGCADSNDPEDQFTLALLDHAQDNATALTRRLVDAAARMDEATITTIHGFAMRALQDNAFASGAVFDPGDNVDDKQVLHQASDDYWRERVFGTQGDSGIRALWPTPEDLHKGIRDILGKPHVQLAGVDHQRADALFERLASQWSNDLGQLATTVATARDDDTIYGGRTLAKHLSSNNLGGLLEELESGVGKALESRGPIVIPDWLIKLTNNPTSQFKKNGAHHADAIQALESLDILAELQELTRTNAVDAALNAIRATADRRKREQRQYSYDDLITHLRDALVDKNTGQPLADDLQQCWPWALVDEFQDTDPLQYACLRRIYANGQREHGALLLIGDPKQAIFSFRGGDIYAYLDAANDAGANRHTMAVNYRSTGAVLAGIETLFTHAGHKPFAVDGIDFPHVDPRAQGHARQLVDEQEALHPALTFWQLEGGVNTIKNGETRNPGKQKDTARLIDTTVAAIARLLHDDKAHWRHMDGTLQAVAPDDIAILVNKNQQASRLQTALAVRGISAVCQHKQSVFKSAEATDLRFVLRALAAPGDAGAVRAAQTTTLIGKRLAQAIELADDDYVLQAAIDHFAGLHDDWRRRGLQAALEQLFVDASPRLLALADGERRMSNYLQLGELLAEAETQCFGMDSVVHWLDRQIHDAEDGTLGMDDASQLRLESDEQLVRISTIHAAKGLEYPIVFLPFALEIGSRSQKTSSPLFFHAPDAQTKTSQACVDITDNAQNKQQARVEDRSEGLRKLYVALTRAAHALFIGWRDPDDKGANSALGELLYGFGESAKNGLLALQESDPQAIRVQTINTQHDADKPPHAPTANPASLGHARTDLPVPRKRWSIFSFSGLAHAPISGQRHNLPRGGAADEPAQSASDATAPATDNPAPAIDKRLSGARFGSAVHAILEEWVGNPARSPWPQPGQTPGEEHCQYAARMLRRFGLVDDNPDDARVTDTINLVARTLHTPLPAIGPLAQLSATHCLAEMGFMMQLGGSRLGELVGMLQQWGYLSAPLGGNPAQQLRGLMQGFIDLIVAVDGRYIVIDYKTNFLGDGLDAYQGAGLQQAVTRSRYDLQYLIYSVALHRHLQHNKGDTYDPDVHLGGIQYLFVRGMQGTGDAGIFTDRIDTGLIRQLDTLLDGGACAA